MRWLLYAVLALGCSKPTEGDCRKAIENIQKITGTEESLSGPDPEAGVRKCRGQATKEAVSCWIAAKTAEDLERCEGKKK